MLNTGLCLFKKGFMRQWIGFNLRHPHLAMLQNYSIWKYKNSPNLNREHVQELGGGRIYNKHRHMRTKKQINKIQKIYYKIIDK